MPKCYSYDDERIYYSRNWPQQAKEYRYLEGYLRPWLDCERMFAGRRVLDIGAGECTYTRLIAELFQPRQIVACELFVNRMLPARQASTAPNLSFVAGDCFSLPFASASFDVIFGTCVLHQIRELDHVLQEIRRALTPDGRYVGIEPNPYSFMHLIRFLSGKQSPNQYLLAPMHLKRFRKYGFQVKVSFFYWKHPRLHSRWLTSSMGIQAVLAAS